eukprot:9459158-Alexandrium_andersonii.AAC.1
MPGWWPVAGSARAAVPGGRVVLGAGCPHLQRRRERLHRGSPVADRTRAVGPHRRGVPGAG